MPTRRRPTIDRAVNDALIALYGPDTGPWRPTVAHDKWGCCWPHQSRPKWFDVAYIDRIIAGYVEEGNQPAADWYRRLKEKRLMAEQWEAERRSPTPSAPSPAADPAPRGRQG